MSANSDLPNAREVIPTAVHRASRILEVQSDIDTSELEAQRAEQQESIKAQGLGDNVASAMWVPLPRSPSPADETWGIPSPEDLSVDGSTSSGSAPTSPISDDSDVLRRIWRPAYPVRVNTDEPPPFSLEAQRKVMEWSHARRHFWPDPNWLEEPRVDNIKDVAWPYLQNLGAQYDSIAVEFLAQGGFNRAFTIHTTTKAWYAEKADYVFRVALPVDPYYKTESDVATTEIVRHFTTIPVPIIYAYDSSTSNALGLEWMLMEKVQGKKLTETWIDLDYDAKLQLTQTVASWTDQLSKISSNKVGGIYMRHTEKYLDFYVGRALEFLLSQENRLLYDAYRGPFESLEAFYDAVLNISAQDVEVLTIAFDIGAFKFEPPRKKYLKGTFLDRSIYYYLDGHEDWTDEQWREEQSKELKTLTEGIAALRQALPSLCAILPETSRTLTTFLAHGDISRRNIFVDDSGNPTALLDWESLTLRPLTHLTNPPDFLRSYEYEFEEPRYSVSEHEARYDRCGYSEAEKAECRASEKAYFAEQVEEYQCTKLRPEYRKELKRLGCPLATIEWDDIFWVDAQLQERVFNFSKDAENHVDWAETMLSITGCTKDEEDEEDESEDEDEEAEDGEKGEKKIWVASEEDVKTLRILGYSEGAIGLYRSRFWKNRGYE